MSEFLVSTSVPLYKLDGVVELPPSKDTSSKVRANLGGGSARLSPQNFGGSGRVSDFMARVSYTVRPSHTNKQNLYFR